MAQDPLKQRTPNPKPQNPLILSQEQLERLLAHSQMVQNEDADEKIRMAHRKRQEEESKQLTSRLVQRKEPGSELKKRQYIKQAEYAHQELKREARTEARKNFVLNSAYKRLFEETDRVKNFKAAKNFAEFLKERDLQVAALNELKDKFSKTDNEYFLKVLRDVEKYEDEEVEKVELEKKKRMINATNWSKQREEAQQKMRREEWEHLRDGCLVRDEAQKFQEEEAKRYLKEKQKIEDYKMMLDEQVQKKTGLMEVYEELDEAEDKRAKLFNEAKLAMKNQHANIKAELDKKKQNKRDQVAKSLIDESFDLKAKEDANLRKAILKTEAKHRDECAVKAADREESQKAIQKFYEQKMKEKTSKELEKRRLGFQERRKILEHVKELGEIERSKIQKRQDLQKEAQHIQMHQIARRKDEEESEKLELMKEYLREMNSLNEEEEMFQKYAAMEIAECEARGIDTYAMRKAAKPGIECGKGPLFKDRGYIRPKYYASVAQGDELNHVKRTQKLPDTKSRLGFILH